MYSKQDFSDFFGSILMNEKVKFIVGTVMKI